MHKGTLEHLRLDPDLVYPLLADEDEDDQWPSVEGFGNFERLRSLDTTSSNLFGRPGRRVLDDGVFRFQDGESRWPDAFKD